MKFEENILQVAALRPDYLGFIFHPHSPRFLSEPGLMNIVPPSIKRVAVFVDEKLETVMDIMTTYGLEAVQLHGKESPEYCQALKSPVTEVIKAFGLDENVNFDILAKYKHACDYFLFDTKTAKHGGSGQVFDWKLLSKYHLDLPFFISGGIDRSHIDKIVGLKAQGMNIYGLDMNSKLEIKPGLKDLEKVKEIFSGLTSLK